MKIWIAALAVALALGGCATRSISDSGYQSGGRYGGSSNPFYKGELSELDVLGIDPAAPVSEADIQAALKNAAAVTLRRGDGLLVVQSGAMMPDEPMVRALERYFGVTVFSGVPPETLRGQPQTTFTSAVRAGYAASLRLAAAKAGCAKVLVYWGTLESGQRDLATKTVSWFPIVGSVVPDETQQMRIRLKVAVIDVATGRWATYSPAGFDDAATSSGLTRAASDQTQVALLKEKSYAAAVDDLVKRYVR